MMKVLVIVLVVALASPSWSAIAFVQGTQVDSSSSLAFGSNVTAGSMLIVALRCSAGASCPSFTDTLSNSYSTAVGNNNGDSFVCIAYALNTTAGANTITQSGCAGTVRMAISEFSGVSTSGALDLTNNASGVSATATSGTVTPTENNEVIIGAAHANDSTDLSASAPFTNIAAGGIKVRSEYEIQTTATTREASFTLTSNGWGCVVASFKQAGAAAVTVLPSILGDGLITGQQF